MEMVDMYYEDFIKRRELKDKWVQYWAVLKGDKIYLYISRDCNEVEFCEVILLPSDSKCILLKRRNYSFRFRLSTNDENYYFKCESNLQRHRWIHMIHLASTGRSPEIPPNHINMKCCCTGDHDDRNNMDITSTSRSKSASSENIIEDGDSVEEATEEKENIIVKDISHRSRDGDIADSCTENNNHTMPSLIRNSLGKTRNIEQLVSNRSKSEDLQEILGKGNNESHVGESQRVKQEDDISGASPAAPLRPTFKSFSFGSFRKSYKRHSFPNRKDVNKENNEFDSYSSQNKSEEKIGEVSTRFAMDNPAFTFDTAEENSETLQPSKIINVSPYND